VLVQLLLLASCLTTAFSKAQGEINHEQNNVSADASTISSISEDNNLSQKNSIEKPDVSKTGGAKEPNLLSELINYKLQFFKPVHISSGSNVVFIANGEEYGTIPEPDKGVPFLKIKLVEAAESKDKIIDRDTCWTIKSVHNNLCLVNDPSIEYIELYRNKNQVATAPWFIMIATGNTIQLQKPDGKPLSYSGISFPSSLGSIKAPMISGMNVGEISLHDFPPEVIQEISKEKALSKGNPYLGDSYYNLVKFPYPNWYYWAHGVAETLNTVWRFERTNPEPGKVVVLGKNYLGANPYIKNHIYWRSGNVISEDNIDPSWQKGIANIAITIKSNGTVKAVPINSQFSKAATKVLVDSLNKLSYHPSVVFPTVFPEKMNATERATVDEKQHLFKGVAELPGYDSITFVCTFHNNDQTNN